MAQQVSILFPNFENEKIEYKSLSNVTAHDLGVDMLCKAMSSDEKEQKLFETILTSFTDDSRVAAYRSDVFEDIRNNPDMRQEMTKLLEQVQVIKDFGILKRGVGAKAGLWELLHKLDEIDDYIQCVEAMQKCLSSADIKSEGLIGLREYIDKIYKDSYFAELKKDIEGVKMETSEVQSVTIGINLNQRFEAESIGLISVNKKQFKNSTILQNFSSAKGIREDSDWNGDMHFRPIEKEGVIPMGKIEKLGGFMAMNSTPLLDARIRNSIVNVPDDDSNSNAPKYLDQVASRMLNLLVKKLKEVLVKYVSLSIGDITNLIPEFAYYIRGAELIEKLQKMGFQFAKPVVNNSDDPNYMDAHGIYNMKLVLDDEISSRDEIVTNDLDFNKDNLVYILTGANRGGKTTITQAIGQLYVMAQGGLYVAGSSFSYVPVDGIFTHFPADEDKTVDLGRLGEECTRFKEMYTASTNKSLMLLNETFSTTSFEEGYYIAADSIKAILSKGIRTIYNTHMHKLGFDVEDFNLEEFSGRAVSLVVKSDDGKRSFKVHKMPPEGMSFAQDIARKYGVTYEMLTK